MEKGSIILIGATTENPSFEINAALLSRCKVFVLQALATEDVYKRQAYTTVGASDKLQAFIDAYKAEYNEEPNMFSALAYDATNVLIQAIEEAGSSDGPAVQAALTKISFDGVTGAFTFDATHTPIKPVLVVNLVDGVQTDAVAVTPKLD